MLEGIVLNGNAGMVHMQCAITYALKLSDVLLATRGASIPVFFQWKHYSCLQDIFTINHPQFVVPDNIITQFVDVAVDDVNSIINQPFASEHCIDALLASNGYLEINNKCMSTYTAQQHFNVFKLTDNTKNTLKMLLDQLNDQHYVAINCRGSDYIKTKYNGSVESFLHVNSQRILNVKQQHMHQKIVLCTDNQQLAVKFVDDCSIFSFSMAYNLHKHGIVLHDLQSIHGLRFKDVYNLSEYKINVDGVLDHYLLFLSSSCYADLKTNFGLRANLYFNYLKNKSMHEKLQCI